MLFPDKYYLANGEVVTEYSDHGNLIRIASSIRS